jgi:hypothetical protein
MPHMTLEPFTSAQPIANVDHVSSLLGIHEELMLLARGRATASALSGRRNLMQGPNLERWQELCRQAATEQDPKRLMKLTAEIIRLLDEKEQRLLAKRNDDPSTSEPTDGAA